MLAVANTNSCVGLQNKIGHHAHCYGQLMQVPVLSACRIYIGSKICVIVFLGLCFKIVDIILTLQERLMCSMKYEVFCVVLVSL